MSLFTDPELPPPLQGNIMTVTGCFQTERDVESEYSNRDFARSKRASVLRGPCGPRGFMLLSVLTLMSLVMLLTSRDHLQGLMTSAFSSSSSSYDNNAMTSSWHFPPPESANPEGAQDTKKLTSANNHPAQDDEDLNDDENIDQDPEETFPDYHGLAEEDVSLLEEFQPMPEMTLHYLWCGFRFFDFRNYVALKSAIEALRPKKVVFHYQTMPMDDPDLYFSWFQRLSNLYPNIISVRINTTDPTCYSGGFKRFALVFDVLSRYGGIYLPEDAIFLRFADRFRHMNFVSGVSSCNLRFFFEGIVIGKFRTFEVPTTDTERVRMLSVCPERDRSSDTLHPCSPEDRYLHSTSGFVPSCVRLETALFPKDVWDAHDKVSTLVKLIAYGKTDLTPRHNSEAMYRTPRLGHYLCTSYCDMSFSVYLSILSALHVAGMQKVLVHGPHTPSSRWWNRLQADHKREVFYVRKDFTYHGNMTEHVSADMRRHIMRTEILLHYGGVFHDSHVLWTQPLPEELLQYEAVVSPDWHVYGNWPESISHTLIVAKGGATYLQQLLRTYWENVMSDSPWVADHYLSYRLIELDPTLVHLHRQLQVKCLNHNCHPTWKPGYRSHFLLNRPGVGFDWRTETLSVHWQDTFQELDLNQIRITSGFIVDIARYILDAAGLDINRL